MLSPDFVSFEIENMFDTTKYLGACWLIWFDNQEMKKNNNERRFFVGGNWKMNYSKSILEKVIETLNKTKDIDGK